MKCTIIMNLKELKIEEGEYGLQTRRCSIKIITEWINPQKNCLYWTVREKDSGGFLGCILLTPHYDGEDTQISYMFLSSFWGNGFAFEAISQVLRHSYENNLYNKLIAEAQCANTSSCNLLKKLGFYEVKRVLRFNAEQVIFAIDHKSVI